jgi:hypothetical protein
MFLFTSLPVMYSTLAVYAQLATIWMNERAKAVSISSCEKCADALVGV